MVTETHVDYKDVTHLNINKQQNLLKQKKNNVKIKEAKKQNKTKHNKCTPGQPPSPVVIPSVTPFVVNTLI